MKFCIVSLLIVTFGLVPTTKSHEASPISVAHYLRQEGNSSADQQKQDSRGTNVTDLQKRLTWKDSRADVASTELTPAVRQCQERSSDANPDKWCKGADKKCVVEAKCDVFLKWGHAELRGACAKHLNILICPRMECVYITEPCPRNWIGPEYRRSTAVQCNQATGIGYLWRYSLYNNIKPDTLYDIQANVYDSQKAQWTIPYIRAKTCKNAEPIQNLYVVSYGLGWIYFFWRRPLEDCFAQIYYDEEYISDETKGNFSQYEIGIVKDQKGYFKFTNFHPCPKYPNWFCFIVSENIVPFHNVTFKVRATRLQADGVFDVSDWTTITFFTDDKGEWFPYCPKVNMFLTFWFLILLAVILLILLIVAAVLIARIYKVKKDLERIEDEPEYEEEKIPPSSILEKIWERIRNFFKEMCPTPQKPPPPPPPPPPEPKPKKKPIPKKKPKKMPKPKKEPKPKAKKPSPSPPPPPPPPPPRPRKKKTSPTPPPSPPEPSGPKAKKDPRGARAETKGRDAAVMDTKRMASGVGGVRARRKR